MTIVTGPGSPGKGFSANLKHVGRIYLDHHATTPVDPAVVAAMLPYFTERFGNPSGRSHAFAAEAHRAVEEARASLAALIGAQPEELVFTSGATEADNLAVRGAARSLASRGKHVVTSVLEHPAVLEPGRTLEREGFAVTRVEVDADVRFVRLQRGGLPTESPNMNEQPAPGLTDCDAGGAGSAD